MVEDRKGIILYPPIFFSQFLYLPISMDRSIVKDNYRFLLNFKKRTGQENPQSAYWWIPVSKPFYIDFFW